MSERERGPRVLVAVGERGLEGRLTRELAACGVAVAGRCLDGPSLAESASAPGVDVVLAAPGLHRLTEETLLALRGRGLPVVLLAGPSDDIDRLAALGRCVPASSGGAVVAQALREAQRRGAGRGRPPRPEGRGASGAASREGAGAGDGAAEREEGRLLAVAGARGAPGATTLAVALAALLSARSDDVVLLDADLRGGNVAPALDLDPRRGLVALGAPEASVLDEVQPGPGFSVLCGLERPALASGLGGEAVSRAARELRGRFGTVIADLGVSVPAGLLGPADDLLVVTGADLLALWNARIALPALREQAGGARLRAAVNRRAGRLHYSAREVERALGLPVAGVVREDAESARRAVWRQIPLPAAEGRASADLHALAAALRGPDAVAPRPARPRTGALLPSLATGSLRW